MAFVGLPEPLPIVAKSPETAEVSLLLLSPAGGDHGRIHWVLGCRSGRSCHGIHRCFCATVSDCDCGRPVLSPLRKKKLASEGVQGVTAAAVGAIAGAAFILSRRSLIDLQTVSIALTTFELLSFKKIPEPFLILAAGMVGPLLFKGWGIESLL